MELSEEIIEYINRNRDEAFELLTALARIPAPSNHEEKRAVFCKEWLERQGAEGVYIDFELNVVYPVGCTKDRPLVVFMAHSDIVFPDTEELPLTVGDGLVRCPGIGDDTANVAALLMAAKYIAEKKLKPDAFGMLIVINSGEEGLGNLRGCRKIFRDYGDRIIELISFDGTCRNIVNRSVGSRRYKVEIRTEGGHSYWNFGNASAIAEISSLICELYRIKVPAGGKTTFNVGELRGGTSVNSIAQHAEMLYEYRSDDSASMESMERSFRSVADSFRANGAKLSVELLGERPCMGGVDKKRLHALTDRAAKAVKKHYGLEPEAVSGSTDCNIPLSKGIPAVSVGCYDGGGAHTREEYVKTESLLPGLRLAFELILGYFR